MESAQTQQVNVYRKMLAASVCSILMETGYDNADKDCIGTLTEMIQCFLTEVGSVTKNYCELSGRSEPLVADVILAFVEMGHNFNDLMVYTKGMKHSVLPPLQPQQSQKQLNMLPAGSKHPLPPYIPQHLPQFPDPHAYVRTPTHKQPIIDYESVREKAAIQKKDIEKALTKYLAKTSPTHNLFDTDEANIFPLIACKPAYPPYLSALSPQDQIFDPEDLEYDHKSQMIQQSKEQKSKEEAENKDEEDNEETLNDSVKSEENTTTNVYIDNPYLAATKLPKKDEMDVT
ncbi:transcription initiation factor TFIID subunit 8-like [Zophobas morio]|uniref:transcription initiation factor TFIID subunit 8-like n=1 Tax=Zophobas morio TaxID=2755281 RepID=UPI0030836B23